MTEKTLTDWEQFRVGVKAQMVSYFRTYRFWVIFGLIVLVGGGITLGLAIKGPAWVHSNFGALSSDYVGGVLGFVPILAIVTAAFFGGDAISTDFGSKSGYFMLALPIRRSVLMAGRYTAALLTSAFAFAIFYGIAVFGGAYFYSFSAVPWWTAGLSFLLSVLLIAGFLSFAFCLSSTSRSTAIGLVVTILVLLVAFQIANGLIVSFLPGYQFFMIYPFASGVIASVIAGVGGASPPVWQSVTIMVLWAVIFYALAGTLYHREEA